MKNFLLSQEEGQPSVGVEPDPVDSPSEYEESSVADEDSDVLSDAVEDIEASSLDEEWYSEPDDDETFDEPPLSDDDNLPRFPHWREGDDVKKLKYKVGYRFDSVDVYKNVLTDWSIHHGYELDFVKCESKRVTAICMDENCSWRMHASTIQNTTIFQVKTLKGKHTCARKGENFRAKAKWCGEKMEQVIRDNPDVSIERFIRIIRRKLKVQVGYFIAQRAKKEAIKIIRGEYDKEFALLRDYGQTVVEGNPGSKLYIMSKQNTDPPEFEKMYYSLRAFTEGFLAGCRPLIGLDGCFIKNVYGGQLLSAIGKDGNDNLFPIAFAYVRVENRENWVWFLTELLLDIGGLGEDKWTFVTDRQKGLLDAVMEVAPGSEHRFCLRHLYQNFFKKWKSQELKTLFWRAASAGNVDEWKSERRKIEEMDPKIDDSVETAYEWLSAIPPEHWARSHFRTRCKSDVLVSNLCESFNNMILPARDLP